MEEIWKDIPEFEGFYQASNLGRVKSLERYVPVRRNEPNKAYKIVYERILSPSTKSGGYQTISLCKKKEFKLPLHRIIAKTFIPLIEGKNDVNHRNGNKKDNRIENLEWCTQAENIRHAFATGLNRGRKGAESVRSKLYLNTDNGIYFYCAKEAHNSCKDSIKSLSSFISMTNGRMVNKTQLIQV